MVPGAGIEPARLAAGDFESPASTNFTTRARGRATSTNGLAWRGTRDYMRSLDFALGVSRPCAVTLPSASTNQARSPIWRTNGAVASSGMCENAVDRASAVVALEAATETLR